MMGPKKLSEIRMQLFASLRPKRAQIEAWLEKEMAKLSDAERRDSTRVETLGWLRDALRAAGAASAASTDDESKRKRPAAADRREPDVGKELTRLRNRLRQALKAQKGSERKAKKTNGKKKPAA